MDWNNFPITGIPPAEASRRCCMQLHVCSSASRLNSHPVPRKCSWIDVGINTAMSQNAGCEQCFCMCGKNRQCLDSSSGSYKASSKTESGYEQPSPSTKCRSNLQARAFIRYFVLSLANSTWLIGICLGAVRQSVSSYTACLLTHSLVKSTVAVLGSIPVC